jgi:hypothetical protein
VKLNSYLVIKQDLSNRDIAKIKKLHKKKNKLFSMVKYWLKKGEFRKVIQSGKKIQEIEFSMQKAWKFNLDESKHTHWFLNPACSCPKMDNFDRFGTGSIYSSKCLVHGQDLLKIKNIVESNLNEKIILKMSE